MKNLLKSICILSLFGVVINAEAKEVTLNLKVQSRYPMVAYYRFSHGDLVYGQGKVVMKPGDGIQHVAVNEIGDDNNVLVQVYKMTVAPWTEINDPCEINLSPTELTANIGIGFIGDPEGRGSFNCQVAAS